MYLSNRDTVMKQKKGAYYSKPVQKQMKTKTTIKFTSSQNVLKYYSNKIYSDEQCNANNILYMADQASNATARFLYKRGTVPA